MSTRTAHERDSDLDGDARASKRFKASPVLPLLAKLVANLLKNLEEIPPHLVVKGFASALKAIVEEERLARPTRYDITLEGIDLQIDALAKEVDANYLVKVMMERLNELKDLLPAAHEAARKAREQAAMPPPILCLRPRDKQGIPLITLHQAFLYFVNESKKPLPTTEVAALKAAFQLCNTMAEPYEDRQSRRDAFNNALDPLISRELWSPEFVLRGSAGVSGRIHGTLNGALASYVLLREDRAELGAKGDPYMEISRIFQAFITWRQSQNSNQALPGVAKFLLTLAGPTLMISGGFYDGKSVIIEPLTPSMIMLPDYNTQGRPMAISQCLLALNKAIDLIHMPPDQPVVLATPRIYSRVLSVEDPLAEIPISFVRPLQHLGALMFLATATVGNNTEECLVKLVYGHYGTEVHRRLALDDLAPRLLGTQIIEGAPTAIAMEYLRPYSAGSEGWVTLFAFAEHIVESDARRSLAVAVNGIVEKLAELNLVHGDLRLNNLMVHVNGDGTVLDNAGRVRVKAIDFDWGGDSGMVTYPRWRNDQIKWPADAGEAIMVGHDQLVVQHWWQERSLTKSIHQSDKPRTLSSPTRPFFLFPFVQYKPHNYEICAAVVVVFNYSSTVVQGCDSHGPPLKFPPKHFLKLQLWTG